jgi:hypothetical protein
MKYFYDTEFLEGTQTKRFLGIPYGKTKPTIDLISIGIVSEGVSKTLMKPCDVYSETVDTSRELYLISKEFNLREAWERHDLKPDINEGGMKKVYWIRENVLKPIWAELMAKEIGVETPKEAENLLIFEWANLSDKIKYLEVKRLINKYGYTNAEIAEKVKEFVYNQNDEDKYYNELSVMPIELYGYYSAYDHVVLCWLFGKMIDLPKGFPMYTIDLQQMLDEIHDQPVKNHMSYPKQANEHNALSDAIFNRELYNFIKSL